MTQPLVPSLLVTHSESFKFQFWQRRVRSDCPARLAAGHCLPQSSQLRRHKLPGGRYMP